VSAGTVVPEAPGDAAAGASTPLSAAEAA
jgi:hypothetical protein